MVCYNITPLQKQNLQCISAIAHITFIAEMYMYIYTYIRPLLVKSWPKKKVFLKSFKVYDNISVNLIEQRFKTSHL